MKKTTIIITLEIEEENEGDAMSVVDGLLDAGILQDAINEYEEGDEGELLVTSAIATYPKED